jgi:hypothetical protein
LGRKGMSDKERLVCHDCQKDERERKVFPVSTYKAIDERYEFPNDYQDHAFCVKCAKENYLVNGFIVSRYELSIDYYYNEKDCYDVVNLTGTAFILRIKEGMYVLKYQDYYLLSPELNQDDFETENEYWEAIDNGRKEVPVSILVLINGKSVIGKGSKQYRTLIEEIIETFERSE